jgi:hypothetical protein
MVRMVLMVMLFLLTRGSSGVLCPREPTPTPDPAHFFDLPRRVRLSTKCLGHDLRAVVRALLQRTIARSHYTAYRLTQTWKHADLPIFAQFSIFPSLSS